MDLSLTRMQAGMEAITRPDFPVIQVLGTNGKGSTCAFLESLARAHGLKTGLYTSPHFVSIRERIRVNGLPLSAGDWLAGANDLARQLPHLLAALTYFEFLTLLAVVLFKKAGVSIAVFEAGLGGAHDATTAVGARCHCFAPIAMDHVNVLGPALADIAKDKTGAISCGGRVFSVAQYPAAFEIIKDQTARKNAFLRLAEPVPKNIRLGLSGENQLANAGLALTCWQDLAAHLGVRIRQESVEAGLQGAFMPGRLQRVDALEKARPLLLDGAHNPHAMRALAAQLPFEPEYVIFSALADKDWRTSLGMLVSRLPDATFIVPQLENDRAADAGEIAQWAATAGARRWKVFAGNSSFTDALGACSGPTLVCGSLYLLAEFYSLYPQYLERQKD